MSLGIRKDEKVERARTEKLTKRAFSQIDNFIFRVKYVPNEFPFEKNSSPTFKVSIDLHTSEMAK